MFSTTAPAELEIICWIMAVLFFVLLMAALFFTFELKTSKQREHRRTIGYVTYRFGSASPEEELTTEQQQRKQK